MDSIEREIVIAAPVERVWAVLTEPEHIAGWFGDSATGDTSVGGELILGWKEHGNRTRLRVVESGFASLDIPADEQAKHAEGNQDGWRQELDELRAYAEA
ncbi:MAG TPA: SRPBCC domain-containing protein [Asanoa sp.]